MKDNWVKKIIRAIFFGTLNAFVFCPGCFSDPREDNIHVLLYYSAAFFVTYEIVLIGVRFISNRYDWMKEPKKIILFNIALILFVFIPINYLAVEWNFGNEPDRFPPGEIYILKVFNLITSTVIIFYLNGLNFFEAWKKSAEKAQKLLEHQTKHELLALKNQINPHFLFNNLNTLSHLVAEKNPNTEEYIYQFSNIYRYLLDQKSKDIVDISYEMKMFRALIYILKIKHGENLIFKFDENELVGFKIATFTLQMLIENSVKHNIISKTEKLTVELFIKDAYLFVKNNVSERPRIAYSSGIGLSNIINRYKILSEKSIIIEESEDFFVVKIPLL